ncbi:hypothetical protein L5515_003038 [Caenorhabditis briggsae]|uniref:Uncharacterized protein n=2 Tax=Caenorhabditis briggsae TaxID=6238 RepID=A0AAE9EG05_CAEBR|nr:hypothetical protein L5515_003038 [Caenorhabditis briggsae]
MKIQFKRLKINFYILEIAEIYVFQGIFRETRKMTDIIETADSEKRRKAKTVLGIGLPAGTDYPNLSEIPAEPCTEIHWRKEVANAFEVANNGYSFHKIANSVFAKDLSGYWYKLNNESRCFEFLFDGFKDTTDYTRISIPPQAPSFVGFNYLHQAIFPMNDEGRPILPKDDKGKTIFPFYEGYPLFPVDDSGAICVPLGDDGKPVFPRIYEEYGAYVPCDVTGRVVLPLDEQGAPIYPRDEEGNVLMPFVMSEDGSRKRAVYTGDDGTPILPFHNGEHALEVHEGEVLFQYEYQQKMMLLAQYPNQPRQSTQLMDEQFYQQHAMQHYQNQMNLDSPASQNGETSGNAAKNSKSPAANLLLKQLSFMKKKQESPVPKTAPEPVIPVKRPAKPNKEKERGERYIPEPSRRNRSDRRDRSPKRSLDRRGNREEPSRNNRRRSRSRSLTWSPENQRNSSSRKNYEDVDRRKAGRSEKRRRERSDSSSDSDFERHERRQRKKEYHHHKSRQ